VEPKDEAKALAREAIDAFLNGDREGSLALFRDAFNVEQRVVGDKYYSYIPGARETYSEVFGARLPIVHAVSKELKPLAKTQPEKALAIADALRGTRWREGLHASVHALGFLVGTHPDDVLNRVLKWSPKARCWEAADTIGMYAMGPLVARHDGHLGLLREYIISGDKWTKRVCLASLGVVARKRPERVREMLPFVEPLMKESDRELWKGVSWALREFSKKDAGASFRFMRRWARGAGKETRWIIKDGMRKLDAEMQDELKGLMG